MNTHRARDRRIRSLLSHRRRLAWAVVGIIIVATAAWAQISTLGALGAKAEELAVCFDKRAGAATALSAMEATAASLAGKLQFAQDSLRQARRALGDAEDALSSLRGEFGALRGDLEKAETHAAALGGDLDSAHWQASQLRLEIENLLSLPPDTFTVTITETVTLPADTIPAPDSWLPSSKKGWLTVAAGFVFGFITRSLLESDDTQTIHVELEN